MKRPSLGSRLIKNSVTLAILALLFWSAPKAQAFFYEFGGEKIIKVADFPFNEAYKFQGRHFDKGIICKQFKILWIPVWNYDARWCGYIDDSGRYLKLEQSFFSGSPASSLPLWDQFSGKVVILLLLVGLLRILPNTRDEQLRSI